MALLIKGSQSTSLDRFEEDILITSHPPHNKTSCINPISLLGWRSLACGWSATYCYDAAADAFLRNSMRLHWPQPLGDEAYLIRWNPTLTPSTRSNWKTPIADAGDPCVFWVYNSRDSHLIGKQWLCEYANSNS